MDEPKPFKRPKAKLKASEPSTAPRKNSTQEKRNFDLQVATLKLEMKVERLEEKLAERENIIVDLEAKIAKLEAELDEYDQEDEAPLSDNSLPPWAYIMKDIAPMLPAVVDKIFKISDDRTEILRQQAAMMMAQRGYVPNHNPAYSNYNPAQAPHPKPFEPYKPSDDL